MTTGFKPCIHRTYNRGYATCQAGEPNPMCVTPANCAPCIFREEPKPTENCNSCIDSATASPVTRAGVPTTTGAPSPR